MVDNPTWEVLTSLRTGRIDAVGLGLGFKVIITDMYCCNISSHELTVLFATRNVKVWVHCYFDYGQNHTIFFFGVDGGIPTPALHFRLSPCKFDSRSYEPQSSVSL